MTAAAPVVAKIRIVIADDHPIVRRGLCQIVQADRGLVVVGESATADETLAVVAACPCDVVILDLGLPGATGFSVLKALRGVYPTLPVLILSIAPEAHFGARAVKAGAAGYVAKRTAPEQLVAAIRQVVSGSLYVSAETGQLLVQAMLRPEARVGPVTARLSPRELDVLRLLGSGFAGKDIATQLQVSSKTVATFRRRLLIKLKLDSTAALIRYAIAHHISEP